MTYSKTPEDFHVEEFVQLLYTRDAEQPRTMAFEEAWDKERRGGRATDSGQWHHNQKQHVVTWFASQLTVGAGAYSRQTPNTSARKTYNRLLNPAMILWIAEALNEDPDVVEEAGEQALAVPSRSRAGAARKVLPWSRIAELANKMNT